MMKIKRILSVLLAGMILFSFSGCVNQHPEESGSANTGDTVNIRLIATSPAVAQICSRLNLDLVGVCQTSSTLPEKYQNLTTVGMAMSPDLEILKSLTPDYVLSPSSPAERLAAEIHFHWSEVYLSEPQECGGYVCFY